MNWLDVVLLIILIMALFTGLKTGIVKAVLSFIGIIVGVTLAGRYYTSLATQLTFTSNDSLANVIAFAIILVAVMIVAFIIAGFLGRVMSAIMLGWLNRLIGAIAGVLLGFTFCGALLAMWVNFFGAGETISNSSMAQFLLDGFPLVLALLPEEFDSIRSFFQ